MDAANLRLVSMFNSSSSSSSSSNSSLENEDDDENEFAITTFVEKPGYS
jgi:hypothetical protein